MKTLVKLAGSLVTFGGMFIFFTGGLLLGLVLVTFGILVLIVAFQEKRKKCPFCAMQIPFEAKVCPHCQRDLFEAQPPVKSS